MVQTKLISSIWKELNTPNSWLFITPEPTRIAITCNGRREDIKINNTGIISISKGCIINTKKILLTPKRIESIPVLAGFVRPVVANLTLLKPSVQHRPAPSDVTNFIIKPSDDMNELEELEKDIQWQLDTTQWKQVTHHSISISIICIFVTLSILIIFYFFYKFITARWKFHQSRPEPDNQPPILTTDDESIELQPLRVSPKYSSIASRRPQDV